MMDPSSERERSAADHARLLLPPAAVIVGLVVGFVSSLLFGAFATWPYFPAIPGWEQYPEPIELTWEKLTVNGLLAFVVLVGVGAAVVLVGRLISRPSVVAAARVMISSVGAWVIVYGWRLTGRDVIGTEFNGGNGWIWTVVVLGLVLFWSGALAGGVDLGIRSVIGELAGRSLRPPRLAPLTARSLMVAGVLVWMWAGPWRTADRVQLSVIATVLCAGAFVGGRSTLRRRPERPNPSD
ncbi:MAG: hypothetical protein WD990_13115 [Acidimicrobiia bacterium]